MKIRLDQLVLARGLADSREQAQRLIMAGQIRVDGHPATKAGNTVENDVQIELLKGERFVSRGGEKLEGAFEAFQLDARGKDCLDVGASTGGFTDCLLQHGAARVIALDVGRGQLHAKLRQDPRVTVIEKFNARHMQPRHLPFTPSIAVTDVSFISLTKILPPINDVLQNGGEIIALIKPQFEAGRAQVGKGGVVRDAAVHDEVVERIRDFSTRELGLELLGVAPSPLLGPKGNREFLSHWRKNG